MDVYILHFPSNIDLECFEIKIDSILYAVELKMKTQK